VVVTVHNDQSRWSDGFDAVTNTDVAVSLGCSWRVAQGLRGRVRVAPNFTSTGPSKAPARTDARLTILCVANVRRQKRIELAVETLASLRARGHDARLILAGGVVPGEEEAAEALRATIEQRGVGDFIQSLGSREDTRSLHSEADVLLTTSLYEGMSVAQLEALSAPIPVVSTDVGGARELATTHGHYHVAEASADALAVAVERAVARPSSGSLSAHFTPEAAARRHVRAYRGAATHRSRSSGLVLVINNLATGGAQASARRLLLALAERGHDVAAAVLQEQSAYPSRWRAELESAMPVFVAPRAGTCPADVTAAAVVDFVRRRRAGSVVFWNVMPLYKLLMADELVGCALHDVSPGEMYFTELDRYFAAPRADLPYFEPSDYGSLLDGVIVKYAAEEERARRGLGAPVTVIPNGVDVTAAPQRHRNGVFVIGTLARIAPDKKLEQLLDAMRVLPQGCELRVAGRVARTDGDYARALAESARDLPVTFVGDVEAQAFLGDLDAFAMVSEPAGCPNALLEAMAAGLPVAATDAGGARDIVGTAGILTPRGDGRGLGEALTRLFVDESLRRAAGVAARERIAERFSLDRMVASYEAVLFTAAS
jgi:glycosyltransferase involved in cell wall biosynthesis